MFPAPNVAPLPMAEPWQQPAKTGILTGFMPTRRMFLPLKELHTRMTVRKFLGLLLALIPLPGLCLDPLPLSATGQTPPPPLGLEQQYLQLATAETPNSELQAAEIQAPEAVAPNTAVPEYPNLSIPNQPDWEGLKDDTKLFILYQLGMVGILYLMPESVSQWDEEDKTGNIFRKWDDNVTSVRKDPDDWAINFIGHPYFGAVYYVRARHRGFTRPNSFWYALAMSTIYEYGIEALFEPVSVQDLIFTPIGGAIMGEYFMIGAENIRRGIAERGYARTRDKVGLFFTDPLGAINEKVNQWFGNTDEQQARLELYPMLSVPKADLSAIELHGVQALYRW